MHEVVLGYGRVGLVFQGQCILFVFVFETGSCYVAQAGLKLTILLSPRFLVLGSQVCPLRLPLGQFESGTWAGKEGRVGV
jgi:hypothetical protein